jgi:hypothetical protein
MSCKSEDFEYLSSEANARKKLLKVKAINESNRITDIDVFKEKAKEFLDYVKTEFNINEPSVISGVRDGIAEFNKVVFQQVDKIRGYDKINAENIRKQLAALEKPTQEVKPGVEELFDSNFLIFAESKTSDEVISKLLSTKIIDKKCN